MKKLLALIASEFGLKEFNAEDSKHIEKLKIKISSLKDKAGKENLSKDSLAKLTQAEKDKAELEKVTTRYTKLKAAKIAKLKELRKVVIKNYTLSVSGQKDPQVIDTLTNADESVLNTLNKGYTQKLADKYPTTCSDCGSHNVTKASMAAEGETGEDGPMSDDQIQSSLVEQDLKSATGFMH